MKPFPVYSNKRIQGNITFKITWLLRPMCSFPLSRAIKHDRFHKRFLSSRSERSHPCVWDRRLP